MFFDGENDPLMPSLANFPSLGDSWESHQRMENDEEDIHSIQSIVAPNWRARRASYPLRNDKEESAAVEGSRIPGQPQPADDDDEDEEGEEISSSYTHIKLENDDNVGELKPEYVRWFFKQEGDKKWIPFLGYDSCRIEYKYRKLKGEDVGACEFLSHLSAKDRQFLETKETIVVNGGLYEVDVRNKSCTSIYWQGETTAILRGTWFYDGTWQPLSEPCAETLEEIHLQLFKDYQPSNASDSNKKGPSAIHTEQFPEFHVEWYSPKEVYLYSEAKSSKFMRSFTQTLGLQKSGYKLQRGFYGDATPNDRQPDITHLVFVIHGVGQKIDSKRIIRNCGSFRNTSNWLKEKYFSELLLHGQRSEFFPVEWRSSLKLDGDTVDSITPHRVRGLREFLNSSAMDIMYYTSPLYRMEILEGLCNELNRLYLMFCEHNPDFENRGGKVSVVAHSLGCIITYDILTGWNPSQQQPPVLTAEQAYATEVNRMNGSQEASPNLKLKFKVENLFCLGSPLAVFLALRGIRPKPNGLQDNILPRSIVKRLFNIYHPADPVAYRLEPLLLKHFTNIMPLRIYYYGERDKMPYEEIKPEFLSRDYTDKRPNSPPIEECMPSPNKSTKNESSRWSFGWPSWARRKNSGTDVQQEMKDFNFQSDEDENELNGPKSPRWHSNPTLPTGDNDHISMDDNHVKNSSGIAQENPVSTVVDYGSVSSPPSINASPKHVAVNQDTSTLLSKVIHIPSSYINASPDLEPSDICHNSDFQTSETAELEYRLDYMLRERNLESSYISALTSHTAYWTSYDVAYFILSYLHQDEKKE